MILKRLCTIMPVFAGLLLLCAGCDEFSSRDISPRLTLSSPIQLNQPVTATIAVDFRGDKDGVGIALSGYGAGWDKVSTIRSWDVGHVTNGEHVELTAPITFTAPGYYNLVASVGTKAGTNNAASLYLYVHQSGAVFNPTPVLSPATPAPAQPASSLSPVEPPPTATR